MSKLGRYIIDQLEENNIEDINELLERRNNETIQKTKSK